MNLFEYQRLAARTIPAGLTGDGLYLNAVLGVNGEAGEMADMLKKSTFQGHSYTVEQKVNEIGDVLWYLAAACTALGVSLEKVAGQNIDKLRQRYPDGFDVGRSVFRDLPVDDGSEVVNEHYPEESLALASEEVARQEREAQMIFTQITNGDFETWEEAAAEVAMRYTFEETVSPAGISRALERLRGWYEEKERGE